MSVIASGAMGVFGLGYCGMGLCMLIPALGGQKRGSGLADVYPSLLKQFAPQEPCEEGVEKRDEGGMSYRLLAYFVLLLGLCRLVTAFNWSCGFVFLGLGTCLAEMGFVAHELLAHDSMLLHRAMAVLFELVVLSLIYLGTGIPYCRV